jgi:hypothetical protein
MSITYRLCAHKGGIDPEDKGKHPDLSGLIKWWGRPNLWNPFGMAKYSHTEIQRGAGDCFSADGYINLVRHKEIRFTHPARWDFFDLGSYSTYEDDQIQWRCEQIEGKPYDYIGALTCQWRGPEFDHRWFCSETSLWIMAAALGMLRTNLYPDAAVAALLAATVNRR